MSGFDNIKKGDFVLVPVKASNGYFDRSAKTFMIKMSVERVTKTLFIANGTQFYKKNGQERTSGYAFYGCKPYEGKDQREEYDAYVKLMNSKRKLGNKLESLLGTLGELNQSDIDYLIEAIKDYV